MKKDNKLHLFNRVCRFLCKIKRSSFIHKIPDFQGPGASASHTSFILIYIISCVVSQDASIFIHILTPDPDRARPLHHTDGKCSVKRADIVGLCWSNTDNHPTKECTALSQGLGLLICFLTFSEWHLLGQYPFCLKLSVVSPFPLISHFLFSSAKTRSMDDGSPTQSHLPPLKSPVSTSVLHFNLNK